MNEDDDPKSPVDEKPEERDEEMGDKQEKDVDDEGES